MGKGRVLRKREYEGGCICVASRALHAFRLALSTSARRKLGASTDCSCSCTTGRWLGHLVELPAVRGRAPPALLQLLRQLLLLLLLLALPLVVPVLLVVLPRPALHPLAVPPQQLVHGAQEVVVVVLHEPHVYGVRLACRRGCTGSAMGVGATRLGAQLQTLAPAARSAAAEWMWSCRRLRQPPPHHCAAASGADSASG